MRTHLISKRADFWLLGGLSLLFWIPLFAAQFFREAPLIAQGFLIAGMIAKAFEVVVFYPHFLLTYKIAYSRGTSFIKQNWLQLLFIPAALLTLMIAGFSTFTSVAPFSAESFNYGQLALSAAVTLMLLTIGWHQAKQTFGCVMVYSRFEKYAISANQKRRLLFTFYAFWAVNIANVYAGFDSRRFVYGVPVWGIGLPKWSTPLLVATLWMFLAYQGYDLVYRKWRQSHQLPSWNLVIPIIALVVWWTPPFYQAEFYLLFSTSFHALQYWPFAFRYEEGKRGLPFTKTKFLKWGGAIIAVAAIAMLLIPHAADLYLRPQAMGGFLFYALAVHLVLNIHHYFVDNTIWRSDQPEIRKYLFESKKGRSPEPALETPKPPLDAAI